MCNCGNKRQQFQAAESFKTSNPQNIEVPNNKMWADVYFEYIGLSALSVKGNITGRHYRFTHPGHTQLVDYRDTHGMMAVPVLKKPNKI